MFGRRVLQPRLIAWAGSLGYRYSGQTLEPRAPTPSTAALMARVVEHTQVSFNHVLINRYRDGSDSIGLHADDEPELGLDPIVATLLDRKMLAERDDGFGPARLTKGHGGRPRDIAILGGQSLDDERHRDIGGKREQAGEDVGEDFGLVVAAKGQEPKEQGDVRGGPSRRERGCRPPGRRPRHRPGARRRP